MAGRFKRRLLGALLAAAVSCPASAALIGPSAYSSAADSPFAGGTFSYFHLETFDDHLLNTPGVTASAGGATATQGFNGAVIDQVGMEGGCPPGGVSVACDTWFRSAGSQGVQFTFVAAALGNLPDAAGLVWTDGGGTIRFEAFDENGVSLGVRTGAHSDSSFFGTTGEDRFYGVTNPGGGISRIVISNSAGGIEIDHLQYGLRELPQPATLALVLAALAALGFTRGTRSRRLA